MRSSTLTPESAWPPVSVTRPPPSCAHRRPRTSVYIKERAAAGRNPVHLRSTYQLWSLVDGRAISVELLGDHPATVASTVDPAVAMSAYLLTIEPAGGVVVAPTSAPIGKAAV